MRVRRSVHGRSIRLTSLGPAVFACALHCGDDIGLPSNATDGAVAVDSSATREAGAYDGAAVDAADAWAKDANALDVTTQLLDVGAADSSDASSDASGAKGDALANDAAWVNEGSLDAPLDAGLPVSDGGADGPVVSGSLLDGGMDAFPDGASDAQGSDAASCDPVAQSGCSTLEKCTVDPPACAPAGPLRTGDLCNPANDLCVAGDLCFSPSGPATCHRFCNQDSDCSAGSAAEAVNSGNVSHCVNTLVGVASGTQFTLCSLPCDPVASTGASHPTCPAGLACVYFPAAPETTDCLKPGNGGEGTACSQYTDCIPGLACADGSHGPECRLVCRVGHDEDCTNGYACDQPAFATLFGVCCPPGGC